jgi:hypothetical protein
MRYRASLVFAAAALLLVPSVFTPSDDDRLAQIERRLEVREYHASRNQIGLQAPNRAQNLRTYFETTGIRVHDRTAPNELFSLALAGMGRGDALAPLPPGEVASEGARVEIRRDGIVEWYENSAAGLEQGFTLGERPAGEGPLRVELSLQGAQASQADDAVIFEAGSGRRLRYDGLVAVDASGRELVARLSVPDPDRVRIEVEDAAAAYPVVIDPLLAEAASAQLLSDQAEAGLGYSVAGAGDVNGDGYDDVIVGAPRYDSGEANEGAAFLFLGSESGIADGGPGSSHARLESNQTYSEFGSSVAGAGDVNGDGYDDVIVGAGGYDAGEADEGAAFVFLGSALGIASGNPDTAAVRIEADQAGASLGWSVAGAGDVNGDGYADVIVGASGYQVGRLDGGCHCWVYDHPNEGAAFLFLGSSDGIADGNPDTAATVLRSNQTSARFALSVAGAGDVNGDGYDDVIVGSPFFDVAPNIWGTALVFLGGPSGIADGDHSSADARLESDEDPYQRHTYFGWSVAGAGDVNGDGYHDVIVGAPEYPDAEIGPGAAFVYLGSASGIAHGSPATAATRLESGEEGNLGISVAGAGDVNGDGHDDLIVGSGRSHTLSEQGSAAFVYLGSTAGVASGRPEVAAARLHLLLSDFTFTGIGWRVAGAGDVDGDGFDDLIAGDLNFPINNVRHGHALVFLGSSDADADGQLDFADICQSVPNPEQIDRDWDGSGNHCDADFDQDGATTARDFRTFRLCYGKAVWSGSAPEDEHCEESDMDADGFVNATDFALFRSEYLTAPGP